MNNDMPYNYNRIDINLPAGGKNSSDCSSSEINDKQNSEKTDVADKKDSRECLDAMGHAQVRMDSASFKGVQKSVEDFMKNPESAQFEVEFCDDLVQKGYNLEDAAKISRRVFSALQNEALYK